MSRTCPECFGTIINEGAHAESCRGPMVFVGYQCARCLAVTTSGERQCFCGGLKHPAYAKPAYLARPEEEA